MNEMSAKIALMCECIDQCFSYVIFCDDFALAFTDEDMLNGAARGFELISRSTLLMSCLSVRKIDDFFFEKGKPDDVLYHHLDVDKNTVLERESFLDKDSERFQINKCVAHLTEQLSLEADYEVDLHAILNRSITIFLRLVQHFKKKDEGGDAQHWIAQTETLIQRCEKLLEKS